MPYYKEIQTLFIHIPKTGGTSLEEYLRTKYTESIFSHVPGDNFLPCHTIEKKSLQHQPYYFLHKYRNDLKIEFNDELKIISVVRNPYNRLISDLFFFGLIDYDYTQEQVCEVIRHYLQYNICSDGYNIYMKNGIWIFNKNNDYDNHLIPQYKFVTDVYGELIKKITIFRTENLTNELIEYGFTDYNYRSENRNYMNYLNKESILMINVYYKRDFELFGYEMVNPV